MFSRIHRFFVFVVTSGLLLGLAVFGIATMPTTAHELGADSVTAEQAIPLTATLAVQLPMTDVTKPPLIGGRRPTALPPLVKPTLRQAAAAGNTLAINLWYGDTQRFGHVGNPQTWVNLLGNVSGPNPITNLRYALNGGAEKNLVVGPDGFRLIEAGDFNIEIPRTDLNAGANQVVIRATDSQNNTVTKTVTVTYTANQQPALPYVANWGATNNLQDLAQVVDGRWLIDNGMVRPAVLGYDRLINLGDVSWSDYEVTVPMIVRGINAAGYEGINNGPGVGLLIRWQGHFSVGNEQPRTGWQNLGALAWYRWYIDRTEGKQLVGYGGNWLGVNANELIAYNTPYMLKLRVESRPGQTAFYSFKMWRTDATEPAGWDIAGGGNTGEPGSGSILLVTHYVDVSFGTVTIMPIDTTYHTINATTDGHGTIELDPDKTYYEHDSAVSFRAVADSGYQFISWGGDLTGSQNPQTIEIVKNMTVNAVFAPVAAPTYKLEVKANGNGAVTRDPNQSSYQQGTSVKLTAIPATGHRFVRWEGDGSGTASPLELTMTKDKVVTAIFEPETYTLSLSKQGNGTVSATPSLLSYTHSQTVTISAAADTGHHFVRWEGGVQNTQNPYTFPMTGNQAITAIFAEDDPIALTVAAAENGSVTVTPQQANYAHGAPVTVTAAPAPGYVLRTWGGAFGNQNPLRLTMTANVQLQPEFAPQQSLYTEDFNRCALDAQRWQFVDPVGDSAMQLDGEQLTLTLPAGSTHDLWPDRDQAPRLLQTAADTDLDVAVKFGSLPTAATQMQGLLFIEDANNWLRADLHFDGTQLLLYAATVDSGVASSALSVPLATPASNTLHLRVTRVADTWTVWTSPDGAQWTAGGSFQYSFVVRSAGLFAGNVGAVAPATTVVVDYFANQSAAPVVDDANPLTLAVNVVGSGTVTKTPDKAIYRCGETVTLTAEPAADWTFSGWQGQVTSSNNPLTLPLMAADNLTATFTAKPQYQVQLTVVGEGAVEPATEGRLYQSGAEIALQARPADGWQFERWSGAVQGTDNPLQVTVNANLAITATFTAAPTATRSLYLPFVANQ
jgi:hypothetical protein